MRRFENYTLRRKKKDARACAQTFVSCMHTHWYGVRVFLCACGSCLRRACVHSRETYTYHVCTHMLTGIACGRIINNKKEDDYIRGDARCYMSSSRPDMCRGRVAYRDRVPCSFLLPFRCTSRERTFRRTRSRNGALDLCSKNTAQGRSEEWLGYHGGLHRAEAASRLIPPPLTD